MTLSRLKQLRMAMRRHKADVFWLPNGENSGQPATGWLSGFSGSDSHLLITKNKATLLTDGRYLIEAEKEAAGFEIVDIAKQSFGDVLGKILPKGGGAVMLDGAAVSYAAVEKVKAKFPGLKIVNENGVLTELRRVKDAAELKFLKKAAAISCAAFKKFLPHVRAGATEKSLAHLLENLLFECGADGIAFPPIIASGRNGAAAHAVPTGKKLQRGELVVIDFGATYRGYVSDMTRTVAVGKVSPRLVRMYEAVRAAQDAGIRAARAGISAHALDAVCRESLEKSGFAKHFTHATGHGIGMAVHELPVVSPKQTDALQVGEVITCEPGVYIKGVGGVRIEDSLAITKNGNINLTARASKKFIML